MSRVSPRLIRQITIENGPRGYGIPDCATERMTSPIRTGIGTFTDRSRSAPVGRIDQARAELENENSGRTDGDLDCRDVDNDGDSATVNEGDCEEIDSIDGYTIADDMAIGDPFDAGDMDYVDWMAVEDQRLASDPDWGEGDDSDTDLSDADSDKDGETGRLRITAHDRHVPYLESFCDTADTSWQAALKTDLFSSLSEHDADRAIADDASDDAGMQIKRYAYVHEQIDRSHGMMQPSMHCPFCNLRKLGEA